MSFSRLVVPPPASFLNKSGSSYFRGSYGYSGRNSVWMTKRAAIFARSIKCLPSTVMVMISLMKPSIGASVAVIFTSEGSAVSRWLAYCCFSSCESKDQCGEIRSSLSQYLSWSRSLPSSIATSLTVIYSAGAGVVPKGQTEKS